MKKITSVLLVSIGLMMVGCGEIFSPVPGGYMKVTAHVLDEQGAPLKNLRAIFNGVDTLYTKDNGVVEYGTICLTFDDYVIRVVLDDANGVYVRDSVDVAFLKADFKPSKQYTLGVAEKETTLRAKMKK